MTDSAAMIVQSVSKSFGKKQVLYDISLNIRKAEIFGLLGPSGSGKTTLVKMIAGIESTSGGTIQVMGVPMPRLDMFGKIGYMAQSDALYNELTARENLDFFAALYGLHGNRKMQRIAACMEMVDLTPCLNRQVSAYSGGMKRRLSLAISLLHEPDILILDEPTVGIDPVLRKSIWNELQGLKNKGTSILLTTHVMDEAEKCDRLGMIRDGKLIAVGTPQHLKEQTGSPTIEEAFLVYGGVKA